MAHSREFVTGSGSRMSVTTFTPTSAQQHIATVERTCVPPIRRSPPRLRRLTAGDAAAAIAGIGGGVVVGSGWVMSAETWSTPGGPLTVLGTLAALLGTYLCLVLIIIVARVPWLEHDVGQDRLIALHRRLAPWAVGLISAHVLATTWGYAQAAGVRLWSQFVALVTGYPWMVPATVAFIAMLALSLSSIRAVRQRLAYESWWVAHLYFYLAVALAFGHQLTSGALFTTYPWARVGWIALYICVAAVVLGSRVILPLVRSARYSYRVAEVTTDCPGVVDVTITGRHLDRLPVCGGQFFEWRFLTRHWWWQAHPYSLSRGPDGRSLRITVKALGDQSAAIGRLRPGTRVIAEGPYGIFTAGHRAGGESVVAIAAGVGVAPVKSMLDTLGPSDDVTVIYRVPDLNPHSIALRDEIEAVVCANRWRLVYVPGDPDACTMTAESLQQLAPSAARADIFVCGPQGFTDTVLDAAHDLGVAPARIHHELFTF